MNFTDSHAHLYDEVFEMDFEQVLDRAAQNEINRMVIPSTDSGDHAKVFELCSKKPSKLFAAYGLHPTSINGECNLKFELEEVEKYLCDRSKNSVAVGEMGLDLYWDKTFVDQQIEAFCAQSQMAISYNLPMIIHTRDAFELLHKVLPPLKGKVRGVIHGFSGTVDDYKAIKSLGGFKFGIGGVVTFKNSTLKDVVKQMDLNDIILETDAPYLTPTPYRGKRNEPAYIRLIAEAICQIKGCEMELLSEKSEKNCNELFFSREF